MNLFKRIIVVSFLLLWLMGVDALTIGGSAQLSGRERYRADGGKQLKDGQLVEAQSVISI